MTNEQNKIDEIKKNATELQDIKYGMNVSDALKQLIGLHNAGYYNFYANINGVKVYTVDVDYERDFKRIVGMSEQEYEELILEEQRKSKEEKARLEKDAKENLTKRINNGKNLIVEQKHNEWERRVNEYSKALYNSIIDDTLKYLELLNNNRNITGIANQYLEELPYSTNDWYQMRILCDIAIFSNNGLEFFKEVINLALEKGIHVSNHIPFINFLKKLNIYIEQGLDYEKASSLSNQKVVKLIVRDEFSEENTISYEITTLQNENQFTGFDEAGNLFIAEIINNSIFHGYLINLTNNEKKYINGEITNNNVVAYTSQSELLDFSENNETGIITIELTSSRKKIIPVDSKISNIIKEFNPVILTRIYNQLAVKTIKIYSAIEEENYKKRLNP